jgi:hypothetical protein
LVCACLDLTGCRGAQYQPRHFREGGNPKGLPYGTVLWIPAFAGMTGGGALCETGVGREPIPTGKSGKYKNINKNK